MVKAIVTRQNPDGTYDEVGMNNRYITSKYANVNTLLRYNKPPKRWKCSEVRYEFFQGDSIFGSPFKILYRVTATQTAHS